MRVICYHTWRWAKDQRRTRLACQKLTETKDAICNVWWTGKVQPHGSLQDEKYNNEKRHLLRLKYGSHGMTVNSNKMWVSCQIIMKCNCYCDPLEEIRMVYECLSKIHNCRSFLKETIQQREKKCSGCYLFTSFIWQTSIYCVYSCWESCSCSNG